MEALTREKIAWLGLACVGTFALGARVRRMIQGTVFDNSFVPGRRLDGYTTIVTGGSSGVGKATAQRLAELGSDIVLACRSMERGLQARNEILKKTGVPSSQLSVMQCDLASLESVQRFAETFQKQKKSLHLLVNNAGVMKLPPGASQTCASGICQYFQVNYLSHFYLTNLLLHTMKQSASRGKSCRIVSVSSGLHKRATINWPDVSACQKSKYGQSKLAQVMWTKELQNNLSTDVSFQGDLKCVSVSPGLCRTNLGQHMMPLPGFKLAMVYLFWPLWMLLTRSASVGAEVVIMACISDDVVGGRYYSNCLAQETGGKDGISNDASNCTRLWVLSENLIGAWQKRKT